MKYLNFSKQPGTGRGIQLSGVMALACSLGLMATLGCNNQRVPAFSPDMDEYTNSLGMKFVRIDPGTFQMGSPEDEKGRRDFETMHEVELTEPYFMATHEVTQDQFEQIMGYNLSYFSASGGGAHKLKNEDTSDHPVENITYDEAVEFCQKLNEREAGAPFTYRMPTEAEWEYACRGGTTTPFYWGEEWQVRTHANTRSGTLYDEEVEQWEEEGREIPKNRQVPLLDRTEPVGTYPPNPWGLYDMSGNVWEFTSDWFDEDYEAYPRVDPRGPVSEDGEAGKEYFSKVIKGGGWNTLPEEARPAKRKSHVAQEKHSGVGFRIVLDPN